MAFADKWLVCVDCGREFLWDAGEQSWFFRKRLSNQPRRCKSCRQRRRDDRLRLPRDYYRVSCANCGSPTFVPFAPRGIKPVYCRVCYTARQHSAPGARWEVGH
jgi:CxxC-x17-CxxC domain-containing protein